MEVTGKQLRKVVAILDYIYNPNKWMARRFPKAAKRKRIRSKWLNRFGPDYRAIIDQELYGCAD